MPKIHSETIDGKLYNIGYKVVTQDLKSLGLRGNTNIHQYPINEWYHLPNEQIKEGDDDLGGIWLARIPSNAMKLKNYMKKEYGIETRIFKSAVDDILFVNSYRLKTNAIMMLEEMLVE